MDLSKGVYPSEIITMNDKPNKGDSQKRSVRSYASRVFQESTIGMVASIATTHSRARKYFKSLLLILCVSGFLYQCITYLEHVFQFPTVVDVDIQRPERYNLPAYTFCNNNGMKRSIFCSLYPDRCFKPSEKFCSRFYKYCGSNDTLVPKKEYYEIEDTMSYADILKYGDNLHEFLVFNKSEISENLTGPYLRVKKEDSGAMICYSLHTAVESRNLPVQKEKDQYSFRPVPENKFTFYLEENEMFIPGNRPGVLFSIHSPFEAVNPFTKGIFMKPGRSYKIYVTMVEEVLLKEPFQTKCMNYEELWEANNRTGPRIQEMCQQRCLLVLCLKCFNCSGPALLYPNNERICNEDDFESYSCDPNDFSVFEECIEGCKDDCSVTKYTPEVMERYEVDYKDEEDHEEFHRYITVEIFLEDGEIMTLKYSPKYMSVEVFSAIGGFIGCWLGISLMDIIDVFVTFLSVFRYGCRKYRKQ